MAEPFPVRKAAAAARFNYDPDGTPRCKCCDARMVEVKPGEWMCKVAAAILPALTKRAAELDRAVFGIGPANG